jgi:ABC-type thiamine transport system ATPase subunit
MVPYYFADDGGTGVTAPNGDQACDVELHAVTKRFGSLTAVNAVSLKVRKGEFLSLLGPSGCGKTTSLRLIAGFEQPDDGEILIGGKDAVGAPPYKRDVNTVFQQYGLFPHMSVLDNVAYGLKQRKVSKPERHVQAREALELVQMTGREGTGHDVVRRPAAARRAGDEPAGAAAGRAAGRARPEAPQGDADRAQAHPGAGGDRLHLRRPWPG